MVTTKSKQKWQTYLGTDDGKDGRDGVRLRRDDAHGADLLQGDDPAAVEPGHIVDQVPWREHVLANLSPGDAVLVVHLLPVVAGQQEEDQRRLQGAGLVHGADDEGGAAVAVIGGAEVVHRVQPRTADPGLRLLANVDDVGASSAWKRGERR